MSNRPDIIVLNKILVELIGKLRRQDFLTYFKKVSILEKKDSTLVLGVVSEFIRDNVSFKFENEILSSAQSVIEGIKKVELQVDKDIDTPSNEYVIDCLKLYKSLNSSSAKKKLPAPGTEVVAGVESRTIQDKYSLKNFVVGPSNQLAFSACQAVVKNPGSAYNPLFIYGRVGLGKTHLLQAVGNELKKKHKGKKVVYTTADRFLSDYIKSVQTRTIERMKDKYRNIDILIMDDVQFLANKNSTQQELYNIFNLMYETGRQIIISSDRPPRELTELEPRLKSRFEWGIIVDVSEPDFETRLAILQEKARQKEFILPQEVAEFIAYNLGDNIRELEGILNQIIAEYELNGKPATIDNISSRMKRLSITHDTLGKRKEATMKIKSYQELISAISDHFGIESENITGDKRKKEYMIPRQVAMYLLKKKMNYTYERIGNIFNGRNHSAIMYSCKKLEQVLKKDQKLFYEINVIRDKLGL